ncbi:acyltransferase family protein [Segatella oris]|uniref:acyltransferase family protein n=1 Tax=Segatella oris TaxID=28135 RepID=UPI0028E36712|nr:acyltransferase family protein [Segatella oris]
MKERLVGVDTVSGIMLIWMMYVVHLARMSGIETPLLHFVLSIMSCFLPWFYFKSGLFFKQEKLFIDELKGNIIRLLIPFLVFSAIGLFIIYIGGNFLLGNTNVAVLFCEASKSFIWYGAFNGNFALWFLLSFFIVKTLFRLLTLLHLPYWIIFIFGLSGVTLFFVSHQDRFLYIGNICNGLVFFSLGVILKNMLFNKWIIFISLSVLILQFVHPTYLDFRASELLGPLPFPIVELSCLAGCVVFYYFFNRIYSYPLRFITYVGKNSMHFYVVHYMIINLSVQCIEYFSLIRSPILIYSISFVILTVSLFVFDKLTQFHLIKTLLGEFKF